MDQRDIQKEFFSRCRLVAQPLQERIPYQFRDESLICEALTHSSAAQEFFRLTGQMVPCNERLEFLGDAVLGLVVTAKLMQAQPRCPEGKLSRYRAAIVQESTLVSIARELGLADCILLSKGEQYSGGREKPSILADTVEAVIGAIYVDGGFDAANQFVLQLFSDWLNKDPALLVGKDFKSLLQELGQTIYHQAPEYVVISIDGPAHDPSFEVEVRLVGRALATGRGPSKKKASQNAAQRALDVLEEEASD